MKDHPRILLAEDNQNDVELTLTALREYNLANRVDVVRDGVEAMDYLCCRASYKDREKKPPVVVLLDIKMPRMDGIEVLRKIKNNSKLQHTPVVMLTSSSMDRDIIDSYDLGANAYVVKPVVFSNFVEAVKNLGLFWALTNQTAY
jgi:CheY-like chemotaxis protein